MTSPKWAHPDSVALGMPVEHTFTMIKPDAVERGLVGEIISRFEDKGLALEKIRKLTIDEELARRHYAEHVEKPFFPELAEFITSGPVIAMEWSGESAISVCRTLMGATDPKEAAPGTIRGDYGILVTNNLVHGSDGPESAARELEIFFG
jgi:nucleoside-diphosphate kinase